MTFPLIVATLILAVALAIVWSRLRLARRADYIRSFRLPSGLFEKLQKRRPELTLKDCQLVGYALRQFFLAYLKGGCRFVSMPSQVTDDLWHELILYTKHYEHFCRQAFGRFMHHTPAVVLSTERQTNMGLRRCWWYACREENINPRNPARLPLLFALDAKLGIADGFRYVPDCESVRRQSDRSVAAGVIYCAGDFASSSVDGSTEGFGDTGSSDGGGGDGGGGGCGGD